MRRLVVVMGLILCGLTNRDALAQDFWYVPSGYDYGYYYGIDLGNGVGYGVGIGVPLSLEALTGSKTADVQQAESPCCDEAVSPPTSLVDPVNVTTVLSKSKPTAASKATKSEAKIQQPKPFIETKTTKTPTHMKAKTGKAT